MDVSKMKVLGILNFNGNIVEFIGDDEYIKNYFTSFYSSMINGNIEVSGESVKVHFINDYICNINNVINYYELGDRLIYYEEENIKCFEVINSWKISFYKDLYVHYNSNYENFDILNQVIRNILLEKLKQRGLVSFHSSCVYHNGYTYIFLGYSGTGKSTFSLALSLNDGFKLINDDRVIVSLNESCVSHFGAPTTFRLGTENLIEQLKNYANQDKINITDEKIIHKTKIGINYQSFFGYSQINNVHGQLIFVVLKVGENTQIYKLDSSVKKKIFYDFWKDKEIISQKYLIDKLIDYETYIFEFNKKGENEFKNTINYFLEQSKVIEKKEENDE